MELTSAEVTSLEAASVIAVLPLAAIEQHGPHLPLGTDTYIAEGFVDAVLDRLPNELAVTFLPVLAVGRSSEHASFPGTVSATWATLTNLLIEIGESLNDAGIEKLVLINSHGGNVATMDTAALELRARRGMLVVATNWYRFGHPTGLYPDDELRLGIHGGMLETAIMLHLRPDLVRTGHLADFASEQTRFEADFKHLRIHGRVQFGWLAEDLNPQGVVGNAAAATAAQGARSIEHGAAAFVELLQDIVRL
ncbi:MAG: creatininase family protein [Hyphomicrobiales bacterium]|nr:creatininase family protein [Hyphomicrobiales bacterium]